MRPRVWPARRWSTPPATTSTAGGAEVGDVVYVVGNRDGRMILIGRLTIDHVVSRGEAEFRLRRELIDKRAHVLTDAPETIVRFDRQVQRRSLAGCARLRGQA